MNVSDIEKLMLVMDEVRRIDERGDLEEIFREDDSTEICEDCQGTGIPCVGPVDTNCLTCGGNGRVSQDS